MMIRRKKSGHPEASLYDILDNQAAPLQCRIVDAGPNPEEICRINEIRGLVAEQMRQLSPRLREALQLFDLDELSTEGASQLLGIGKSAFKSRVSRARRKLANKLQRSRQQPKSRLSRPLVATFP
jgi:RNA polymerase sigma factor (sigma-70 family)